MVRVFDCGIAVYIKLGADLRHEFGQVVVERHVPLFDVAGEVPREVRDFRSHDVVEREFDAAVPGRCAHITFSDTEQKLVKFPDIDDLERPLHGVAGESQSGDLRVNPVTWRERLYLFKLNVFIRAGGLRGTGPSASAQIPTRCWNFVCPMGPRLP